MQSKCKVWTVAVALVATLVLSLVTAPASADDVVILKTGEKVRGDIIRELEGSVWVIVRFGTVEQERFFTAGQIKEIVRDAEPVVRPVEREAEDDAPGRRGVPRAAIISLEGTVGIQMASKTLLDIIPDLEKEIGSDGSGIVVFKINSGGGLLLEIQKLSDVIQNEYKPRFRVVSWIESAISAAAMTSHCVEEIYFLPEGNYGACTGWSGALSAVKGRGYEQVLYQMELISDRGGYDHQIMKAMQGHPHRDESYPLSASIDENGTVHWYQNTDGDHVINPPGEVLTFNSVVAERFGFSKGTARNLEELTEALREKEIEWVGRPREGLIYPVSRAEAKMIRFREQVTEDEARFNEYYAKYAIAVEAAAGAPAESRGALAGRARRHLRNIVRMFELHPNLALMRFNGQEPFENWVADQEELIRRILRGP